MKKKRTVPRFSIAAGITWRVGILVGVLYFTAMSLLTVIAAKQLQDQWADHASRMTGHYIPSEADRLPGEIERRYIQTMYSFDTTGMVQLDLPLYIDPMDKHYQKPYGILIADYETAVVFYEDDVPVLTHGDYIVFDYLHADSWSSGKEAPEGYAYIDLKEVSQGGDTISSPWARTTSGLLYHADLYRLTGCFEGNRFVLQELAGFEMKYPTLYAGKSLPQWDLEGKLNWDIHYVNPEKPTGETVCLYTTQLESYNHITGDPWEKLAFGVPGTLEDVVLDSWPQRYERYSLWETVIVEQASNVSHDGTHYKVVSALRCQPLFTAVERLWPIYFLWETISILAVLGCYFLLKRRVRDPLQQIIHRGQQNMLPLHFPYKPKWKEPCLLEEVYIAAQQELQTLRQENTRLKTALQYARDAEDNRRQMVSNITHELKTPLAVIHSYAEGLRAGIAPEKQEKYLDTITREADRMDAMVLEMLDLSRLEAGKVHLAQDRVELLGLTRGILDKLSPLLEQKELTVQYTLTEECILTADEARLSQVITNLATNAIKYSPEGGQVLISLFQRNGFIHFSIENESAPLSEEALEKVWESFYRTEQSRTTKGTGLGLAISKAIIDLHRGTCHAKNTSTGVEFSFRLPGS